MAGRVAQRLEEMGLTLPDVATPVGKYLPAVRAGQFIYTSGQLPLLEGNLAATGKVGMSPGLLSPDRAERMAVICALNGLAAIAQHADLDTIQVVKVTGFVASEPGFTGQPAVINGASELLGELLAERGVHARSAVGVASLPLDAPVEIEFVAQVIDS